MLTPSAAATGDRPEPTEAEENEPTKKSRKKKK